jgi:Protein of unknown function (DUF3341)
MRILLASFETEQRLTEALPRLRAAGLGAVETYTPKRLEDDPDQKPSVLPLVVLIAGLLGFAAGFAMQAYANMVSYPVDIGGRPTFSWPAFVPIAFENGILVAMLAGFIGFLVVNRLPRLWEPVDEAMLIRRASRDLWCVAVRTDTPERTHDLLRSLSADRIEEVAA